MDVNREVKREAFVKRFYFFFWGGGGLVVSVGVEGGRVGGSGWM